MTVLQMAFPMTPLSNSNPTPSTCTFTGYKTMSIRDNSSFTGPQSALTLQTTSQSTTHPCITKKCISTFSIALTHHKPSTPSSIWNMHWRLGLTRQVTRRDDYPAPPACAIFKTRVKPAHHKVDYALPQ